MAAPTNAAQAKILLSNISTQRHTGASLGRRSVRTWNIGRLSSGEKQRLGLVRALMLRSRVLLLDEPTSALDSASTAAVELIVAERISTGTSVIWSTHDRAQAQRVGSRVFIMNSGGRIEEHSP
jgi:putative ABC transport system ATP-binding protein